MDIAYRVAMSATRRRPAHEHQLMSAAQDGLMRAAESYDRLGITLPWEAWAAIQANRAITNYLKSPFGRRFEREKQIAPSREEDDTWSQYADPMGEAGQQAADIEDLLSKIPTYQHALLARRVVFDQMSKREAGEEAGFHNGNGPKAWDKVAKHLIRVGDL